ncbi:aspartyl protease family protein [Nonlabens antarcticus]|uniref:aspartyl protease family protein n=1 Tax=Nonlabens antarcticus TaxID=392714 RepID=UPI00189165F9|nr:aspartyl protease family protein [Nonlabens antarcticus]
MRIKSLLITISCFGALFTYAQKGFHLPEDVDRLSIPFAKVFNLIVVPMEVNGTPLNFILDTGASKSIIFNLGGVDSLLVAQGKVLQISGYGTSDTFEAYYSENNKINVKGFKNDNAEFLIMAGQEVNLAEVLGLRVNGLIGTDFFTNSIVEIDYANQKLTILKHNSRQAKRLQRQHSITISFINKKPFIPIVVQNEQSEITTSLLIDTGNGDALWLWNIESNFTMPQKGFEDRVGVGMNGNVEGFRSKLDRVSLGDYQLNRVTVSFPNKNSYKTDKEDPVINDGTIGGEVLSRFKIFLDYKNSKMYLEPNRSYKDGFYYNMAGIELSEGESEIFTVVKNREFEEVESQYGVVRGQKTIRTTQTQIIKLVPKVMVRYVRPNSPADFAGVKAGDQITRINRIRNDRLTLNNTASKFFKDPYSKIRLRVLRGQKEIKIKFVLKPIID